MVRTRPRNVPNDREIGRRSRRASVAPTGDKLRRRFHQLTLEELRHLFNNSARIPLAGRIPWHQSAASRSWIPATSSATTSLIQVPEISSQSMEEDVEIIEEPVPQPMNIQPSQAPPCPETSPPPLRSSWCWTTSMVLLQQPFGSTWIKWTLWRCTLSLLMPWMKQRGTSWPPLRITRRTHVRLGWNCQLPPSEQVEFLAY